MSIKNITLDELQELAHTILACGMTQGEASRYAVEFFGELDDLISPTVKDMQDELDLADEEHYDEIVSIQSNINNTSRTLS